MIILGIESSCDDTSIAIVDGKKNILSLVTKTQINEHKAYGGVVPEIASRSHLDSIKDITEQALDEANISIKEIDAVAATCGPGLIGGIIVGSTFAKGIAAMHNKDFIAINHLEGHALTARLTNDVEYPFLLLLISGGHCQVLIIDGIGKYKIIGQTLDDAAGEAFDKVAKMMHLGFPGGPIIEKRALSGNATKFNFPISLKGQKNCNFSFSGLKTAVKRQIEKLDNIDDNISDISASFQRTVGDILHDRIKYALEFYSQDHADNKTLVISGGVASNKYLKTRLDDVAQKYGFEVIAPPMKLCVDNAAMIAWAGIERLKLGIKNDLSFTPRSRWSLEDLSI